METIATRRDFLAAAKGFRRNARCFSVQARMRSDDRAPRFGFTVTKRVSKSAVVRNRIRRRLREAVRLHADDAARAGTDYVLVARAEALTASFSELADTLRDHLHAVGHRLDQRSV